MRCGYKLSKNELNKQKKLRQNSMAKFFLFNRLPGAFCYYSLGIDLSCSISMASL